MPHAQEPFQFSAAQLAKALGKSKRAVLYVLRDVPHTSEGFVNGQRTKHWTLDALPSGLREELETRAQRSGYRNSLALLQSPSTFWKPPVALAEVSPAALAKATRLQRALRPVLERMHDLTLTESEFEQHGVEHYKREVGHAISARHWRRVFQRTCTRDNGAEDWSRLEIYLDESPVRRPSAPAGAVLAHHELTQVIAAFKSPAEPTPQEVECLWLRSLEFFAQRVSEGRAEKRARRELLAFLHDRARFLAGTREGLRKQFERKLQRWRKADGDSKAIADGRRERSGNFRAPELSKEDRDKLIGHAVLSTGGRVAQAFRELKRAGELSEKLISHYLSNPARKSYVPRRIMQDVKWDVAMLDDIHHGPRQAKLNGPHIERDWSKVFAGDFYQADDVTFPVYYYEPDGKGWFTLWRGQCLLMIDLRTTRILNYALLSSRNYNSLAIRTLITRTCDDHGLPRQGFYFELGVWLSSKLLAGDKAAPISLPEAERGLRDLGLKFVHSNLPRSKPVERTIGALQSLMEGVPGYVGRDERHDRFERVQKLKLQVESNKLDPEGHFLSAAQWLEKLDELCVSYNAEPQQGKMLDGLSPDAAFEKLKRPGDPQIRFDADCRYLLAHHKRPVRVTSNGITLRFGKNVFTYRNKITGRLIGQTVLAWFNLETPEILSVTDMDRKNPFTIERAEALPAMDATPEQMAGAMEQVNAHLLHARAYYRSIRSATPVVFRRNLVDRATSALGREMGEQQAEIEQKQKQKQKATRSRTVHRRAQELGLPASILDTESAEGEAYTRLMLEARRDEHAQDKETQ